MVPLWADVELADATFRDRHDLHAGKAQPLQSRSSSNALRPAWRRAPTTSPDGVMAVGLSLLND